MVNQLVQRFGDHAWDQSAAPPMPMARTSMQAALMHLARVDVGLLVRRAAVHDLAFPRLPWAGEAGPRGVMPCARAYSPPREYTKRTKAAGLNLIDDVALIIEVKPVALTFPGC